MWLAPGAAGVPVAEPAPPVEVLFDAICRENGVQHLLTRRGHRPRWGRSRGSTARCGRSLTPAAPSPLPVAQGALDEWVGYYNTQRPHQALDDDTPADRFQADATMTDPGSGSADPAAPARAVAGSVRAAARDGDGWVSRRVGPNGVVSVSRQQCAPIFQA